MVKCNSEKNPVFYTVWINFGSSAEVKGSRLIFGGFLVLLISLCVPSSSSLKSPEIQVAHKLLRG